MSYDSKCYELAAFFAADWKPVDSAEGAAAQYEAKELLCKDLAQLIQDVIEEFEATQGIER